MTQAGLQVISASDTEYSRFIRIIDFEGPISNFKISLIITKAGVRLSMNNHDCSRFGNLDSIQVLGHTNWRPTIGFEP